MCGIAGLINRSQSNADPALVRLMTQCMSHRGPDAEGIWADGQVALGHRRLSIIDLSDNANQPLADRTGSYVITFNGELYNYQAIRQELTGYSFQTNSDTEVILAAYERWGTACLEHFNGMFAFAIWDQQAGQLFAARDRLGKKPFYYYQNEEVFLFASEVGALLQTDLVPRRLNRSALPQYLMYQTVAAPDTLVKGINQLPAGHFALLTDHHQWMETCYWDVASPPAADPSLLQDRTAVQHRVRNLLQASVARRIVSDVPLGAFLSGGIDSSAVVALMAEQSDQPVNTFTVTFQDSAFDESVHARAMANRFNTRHTELPLIPDRLLAELPAIMASMDQPSGDGPNTYMVSKLTKEAGITVALSGLGGDEVFAGYSTFGRYARLRQLQLLWKLPKPIRQTILRWLSPGTNKQKLADLIALPSLTPTDLFPLLRQSTSALAAGQLLGLNKLVTPYAARFQAKATELSRLSPMSQLTVSELLTYTEPLLLRDSDQMSMAHALELRVPFLDHELIDFMIQVPDQYKTTTTPKQLLIDSLQPLLPGTLLQRPKMGFSFPWDKWMRRELKEFCSERIQRLSQRDLFEPRALLTYYQRFLQAEPTVSWNQIWLLVVLEDWLERNQIS
ncbi:asparagine synthase (glutamine-hydrolyzing) [Fibrella forsythiae]|uniref:asparagine synthase (glutamine-hydrolyzing) n=1 Tax=Fibrella forsythiae TaxID=2817061 RepID=A0ABS3JQP2_9BACT|nr:asparagine synthase (glutamine-hydrolyzing) [Fibrella forsythiae]MBO0952317.1 asparagine synthase (glutamine-hydrolyzing) [Fibrella forsythiae]